MSIFCLENGPLFISQNHWANTSHVSSFSVCPLNALLSGRGHGLFVTQKAENTSWGLLWQSVFTIGNWALLPFNYIWYHILMKYVYSKNPQSAYKSIVSCFCFHSYLKLHLTSYLRSQHCVPHLSHWIPELLLFMRRASGQLAAARLTSTPYKQT